MALIRPFRKDHDLRQEILKAKAEGTPDQLDIWWLGQSGFLVQWNKKCVLFDPYLSDSLTKKYADTAKPHVRMSERVIQPELLDMIDVVTSSHNHTDHLDGETLIPLLAVNPGLRLVIPEANRAFVADRIHCKPNYPHGMSDTDTLGVHELIFYGVPAAHNTIERDEQGKIRCMGLVVAFGKWVVYHSGDTLWNEELVRELRNMTVNVAFLPINGNDPARGVAGNLSASEAAQMGKAIRAGLVIPHHYHMFEFNTADPDDFARSAKEFEQPYRIAQLGERIVLT